MTYLSPMPTLFEIHITTTELDETLIEEFVAFCATIEAKPIVIELPVGQQMQQPMISKVVKLEDPQEIHPIIAELESAFVAAGFPVERVKVEVPLPHEKEGRTAFPNFRGGYYEWHGKVKVSFFENLKRLLQYPSAHLSSNSLKGQQYSRLITLRETSSALIFKNKIESLTKKLTAHDYPLLKAEAEYCCYDSNKNIDQGWSDIPEITDTLYLYQRAFDAFLRRVSEVDAPFMVKGSVIMRQYLAEPGKRNAADLDFFYLKPLPPEEAEETFTNWLLQVTETKVEGDEDEDVFIRSFREDTFWRGVDYSMKDDFPTTNTDILCQIGDNPSFKFGLDISWNLPLTDQPVPLEYRPIEGDNFILPLTVPLSLQISWKLHQSVVSPRHKDFTDLISLLKHPRVTLEVIVKASIAYKAECRKDNIKPLRIGVYLQTDIAERIVIKEDNYNYLSKTAVSYVFDEKSIWEFQLPEGRFFYNVAEDQAINLPTLLHDFRQVLLDSGIDKYLDLTPRQ